MLLISRGVVEAAYKRNEFGLDRVKQILGHLALESASDEAAQVLDAVREFMHDTPTNNDLTTFALIRLAVVKAGAGSA